MTVRIGINGFGRIGRQVFRAAYDHSEIEVVAVNDLTDSATLAHLLKYDSVHGIFAGEVSSKDDNILVDGKELTVLSEKDPSKLPWKDLNVDIVVEATGRFTQGELAAQHIQAGAKKVVISAPAKGEDLTVVLGVNHELYDHEKHHVVSNASCTTNCLAPVAKAINDKYGIVKGLMTTVHAYTNDQKILDLPHKDLRRARAAGMSIIPTTTGAAKAVSHVIPELKGKLNGMAMRVPTPDVSVIDLVVELEKEATAEDINNTLREFAANAPDKVMQVNDVPLVSIDYTTCPYSSVVDSGLTMVMEGNLAKIISWYDNEWAYSNRVVDLVRLMVSKM